MLYQNRQLVLSQLLPLSGQYLVKLNRSVESLAKTARKVIEGSCKGVPEE
jgi:hypothetical protein